MAKAESARVVTLFLDGDRRVIRLKKGTPEEAASRAVHNAHLLQLGQVTYHYIGDSPQGQRQYMRLR